MSFDDNLEELVDIEKKKPDENEDNMEEYMDGLENRIMSVKRKIADAENDYKNEALK